MATDQSGFCVVDSRGRIVAADDAIAAFNQGERAGTPLGNWRAVTDSAGFAHALQRILGGEACVEFDAPPAAGGNPDSGVHIILRRMDGPDGRLALVEVHPSYVEPTAPARDALTHLPDRRAIAERAAAWRRAAAPARPSFAVLFLDLDGFKSVNDRLGHAVGDAVLGSLASRWLRCVRDGDLVARYGGDEFVLLIRDAATADDVEPVMQRLRDVTAQPIRIGDEALSITATIGWSTPTDDNWTIDALVAAADRDMYARKRACATLAP